VTWDELAEAAASLGAPLDARAVTAFQTYADELLRWNRRVNLTRVVDPGEVVELHFLDSLTAAPFVRGHSLLDLGAGAGFPGLALKIRDPSLELLLVDAEKKKVSFLKSVIVRLGIADAAAVRARAEGRPGEEGIAPAETVISRALMALGPWLELARRYVLPGGRVVAMLGRDAPDDALLAEEGFRRGLGVGAIRRFKLPSGATRAIVAFDRTA
jgi:16S rRNA (guanine527-N7)-methyltransferase